MIVCRWPRPNNYRMLHDYRFLTKPWTVSLKTSFVAGRTILSQNLGEPEGKKKAFRKRHSSFVMFKGEKNVKCTIFCNYLSSFFVCRSPRMRNSNTKDKKFTEKNKNYKRGCSTKWISKPCVFPTLSHDISSPGATIFDIKS